MFSGLKLYTVHTKSSEGDTVDKPVFVREGFNILAFLFTLLWALYHRCYRLAAIIVLINIALVILVRVQFLSVDMLPFIQLLIQLIIGFEANDFLRARLTRSGYTFQDLTSGESLLRAEQRYFDRLVARPA